MTDLVALRSANADRWAHAKLTQSSKFNPVAARLAGPATKARYLVVAARTGVPWFVIAVIHERECSQSWSGSLAQGDPWNKKSVHVPAGRGPFASWEDAAVDALVNCPPYAAGNKDWSVGGTLTLLEQYNGLGYANRGRSSPYIWAGTNQYVSGKYIRDGVYDATEVDSQLGCAGLLLVMMAIDPSVKFGAVAANNNAAPKVVAANGQIIVAADPGAVPAKPSITHPAPGSIGAWISSWFKKAA